jgi:WD40 repeat protein
MDGTVRLWTAAGEPRGVLAGHSGYVSQVLFTPAGDRILTVSGNTARLWSVSGILLGELTGHTHTITWAAVRSDGGCLATASWDHSAAVWDLARVEELRPLAATIDRVQPAAGFDASGRRLAVRRTDETLSVIDAQTGAITCTTPDAAALRFAWASDEEIAVVRRGGRVLELRDARRCAVVSTLDHPAPIEWISAGPGSCLVTLAGGVIRAVRGGRLEASFAGYTGQIQQVGCDGDDVYAITYEPSAVVVDTIGDPARRRILRPGPGAFFNQGVWFDREQGRIVGAGTDGALYIWDATTGAVVRKLEGTGPLMAVRTSPSGTIMIGTGGVSPTVWDRKTGVRIRQLEGPSDLVKSGEFLDDQLFISLALNRIAIVSDVATGRALTKFHDVDALAVSPDRSSVALISTSGIRMWSPRAPVPDLDALPALHLRTPGTRADSAKPE